MKKIRKTAKKNLDLDLDAALEEVAKKLRPTANNQAGDVTIVDNTSGQSPKSCCGSAEEDL